MKRATLVLGATTCMVLTVVVACHGLQGHRRAFQPDDVVGTWIADYSQYTVPELSLSTSPGFVSGKETVILEPDGSYWQTFNTETSISGSWTISDGDVLHLQGAKTYVYGLQFAERLASGDARGIVYDCHGQQIEISQSELLLCIRPERNVTGGIVLQHLEVGDPDSPEVVTFFRTSR
jgi:hypothetical protein